MNQPQQYSTAESPIILITKCGKKYQKGIKEVFLQMNELQLSNDLNVITAEIIGYQNMAGQSIFEIGRRLKHVKENDLVHGEFGEWLETIKIHPRVAQQMMKVSSDTQLNTSTYSHLSSRVLYEIATLPEEERTKEHILPSGETKKIDEMTVKELKAAQVEKSVSFFVGSLAVLMASFFGRWIRLGFSSTASTCLFASFNVSLGIPNFSDTFFSESVFSFGPLFESLVLGTTICPSFKTSFVTLTNSFKFFDFSYSVRSFLRVFSSNSINRWWI